jgi:4,5-DOPA dioxygenase extradiol
MADILPTLFLSHGSPALSLDPGATGAFWERLGRELPRPEAVLCVSAHWMTEDPAISAPARNDTIHDFFGFPEPLYRMAYPAPGAPALAERVFDLLGAAGMDAAIDRELSIQPYRSAAWHDRLGAALAPLRREGVLVLASGGAVHNLRAIQRQGGMTPAWAQAFDEWLAASLAEGRREELLDWLARAPYAREAQPTPDHFLPLFVALGAAGPAARGERLHQGFTLGTLSMAAFRFAA